MYLLIKNRLWLVITTVLLLTNQALGHGMSESEKEIIIEGGNLRYIWIGATHMLSGYDHLAFVFGIVFFLTKFKDIVKYITAFTIGHSITLIFATFNTLQVNYFLIDAIIALSVCYIAFHNLNGFKKYLNLQTPNMLIMIFSLGLIHGLGLSTRLQELPLSEESLLLNIISFNVGIEFGQISALAVMFFLMRFLRTQDSFQKISKVTNVFLILFGGYLFGMQMYDYVQISNQKLNESKMTKDLNWKDTIIVTIPALGEKEYKVQVSKESTFSYSWKIDKGVLYFDFHGEPKDDTTGYFKTFKKGMDEQSAGSLTTIFSGTHGWYWKNYNSYPVFITLNLKGEYQRLDLKMSSKK